MSLLYYNMNIIMIKIVENDENFVVLGLGNDNIMYFWDVKLAKWLIYKVYE